MLARCRDIARHHSNQGRRCHDSARCYATFWTLTLHDIKVPKERYDDEISKIKKLLASNDKALNELVRGYPCY